MADVAGPQITFEHKIERHKGCRQRWPVSSVSEGIKAEELKINNAQTLAVVVAQKTARSLTTRGSEF